VLLTQHFAYRHLTEAELRFEAMQTLAFGGRGLIWFTYWMPAGVPEPQSWQHSMILADGSRDPHYDQVKRLNQEIKALGDALAGCESTAVFQQGDAATIKSGQPPIDAKDGKLTIGVFQRRADGKTLALVTNRDYQAPVSTSVRVQPAGANVERFDAATRQWSAAEAKDAALPLTIPAGDGVLLRW
jgi:hypothetical protein